MLATNTRSLIFPFYLVRKGSQLEYANMLYVLSMDGCIWYVIMLTLYPCQNAWISRQASSSDHSTDFGSGGRGLTTNTLYLLYSEQK